MKKAHVLSGQIAKFIIVGGINTLISYGIFFALTRINNQYDDYHIMLYMAVAFVFANLNSYIMNKRWTFGDKEKSQSPMKFSIFFTVSFIGLCIGMFTSYVITTISTPFFGIVLFQSILGASIYALWADFAFVVATGFQMIWNFVGYKLFVFKK